MAYYCCECSEWLGSNDAKMSYHNGRYIEHRWCEYDRKYRAKDQEVYRCGGFVYVRRAIITKICEILGINGEMFFNAFDDVKDNCIVPTEFGKLVDYNTIASSIADGLNNHAKKGIIAKNMLDNYIIPALAYSKMKKYDEAVNLYEKMVKILAVIFDATKEQVMERQFYNNLIRIH